jgi:hypothetical protein
MTEYSFRLQGADFQIIATTARTVTVEIIGTSGHYPTKGLKYKTSRKSIETLIAAHTKSFNEKQYKVVGVSVMSHGIEDNAFGNPDAAERYVESRRVQMWACEGLVTLK